MIDGRSVRLRQAFRSLEQTGVMKIVTKKPLPPINEESARNNPRGAVRRNRCRVAIREFEAMALRVAESSGWRGLFASELTTATGGPGLWDMANDA